jgi:hypothetical protein
VRARENGRNAFQGKRYGWFRLEFAGYHPARWKMDKSFQEILNILHLKKF